MFVEDGLGPTLSTIQIVVVSLRLGTHIYPSLALRWEIPLELGTTYMNNIYSELYVFHNFTSAVASNKLFEFC